MKEAFREVDVEEIFCRAGGPGGQHVNKVSTSVTLRHVPSGTTVTASESRSQAMNRAKARERLAEKLGQLRAEKKAGDRAAAAKARRQRARRSKSNKRKLVEGKRRRSAVKALRSRVQE